MKRHLLSDEERNEFWKLQQQARKLSEQMERWMQRHLNRYGGEGDKDD